MDQILNAENLRLPFGFLLAGLAYFVNAALVANKELREKIAALELKMSDQYVKKEDFKELKDSLEKKKE